MMSYTARLELPCLVAGQAHKEIQHNEALQRLDALVQPVVATTSSNTPPTSPTVGELHIVGDSPEGDWAGHAGALAAWTAGGWRFIAPFEGLTVRLRGLGLEAVFGADGWIIGRVEASEVIIDGTRVLSNQQPKIADPVGGGTVDVEVRSALSSLLAACRAHGLIAT